jgi:hypothetical protein
MHRAQNRRDISALIQNLKKCFVNMTVFEELAIHKVQFISYDLRQIRMKSQAALLRVKKHPHQPSWLIAKCSGGAMNLAVANLKAIDYLLGRAPLSALQHITQ